MKRLLTALAMLVATQAHAGKLTGHVTAHAPSSTDACDSLGAASSVPHRVHARIMAGSVRAWEDSVACQPGKSWELFYPQLQPGTYQASSWTTKATNRLIGCPDVITLTVEPAYSIIFGWNTIGAVFDQQGQRVIGMAEMLRRLQACDSLKMLRP